MERWKGSQGRKRNPPPPLPQTQELGDRSKKTEAAFTLFTSNPTLQGTILIAQSRPWVAEAFHGGVDTKA